MPTLIDQPTPAPTRKVQFAALAGAITWALTAGLARLLGEIPADLATAIPVAAATLAGYAFRDFAPEE